MDNGCFGSLTPDLVKKNAKLEGRRVLELWTGQDVFPLVLPRRIVSLIPLAQAQKPRVYQPTHLKPPTDQARQLESVASHVRDQGSKLEAVAVCSWGMLGGGSLSLNPEEPTHISP